MKKFIADIDVMLLPHVLDTQGQAVEQVLQKMHIQGIEQVRIGKHIIVNVTAKDELEARQKINEACQKLLHNPVIEFYTFELEETKAASIGIEPIS